MVNDERFSSDTIKAVIELEKRAHKQGSTAKLRILNEALRQVTFQIG